MASLLVSHVALLLAMSTPAAMAMATKGRVYEGPDRAILEHLAVVGMRDPAPTKEPPRVPRHEESASASSWWEWLKGLLGWGSSDHRRPAARPSQELKQHEQQQHLRQQPTQRPPPLPRARASSTRPTYNETLAKYLAYVTSVAYCQAAHIVDWSCSPCRVIRPLTGVRIVEDPKDNFQGLVGFSRELDVIVVAFRGSMDVTNWLDNLTFVKRRAYPQFPDVAVHQGFYWAFESVAPQVLGAVAALRAAHPTARVVVTGHSLGGAVAALCGFELAVVRGLPVERVYTFGEPRVGNGAFSARLNGAVAELFRVTHYRDVVPHLPPTWLGFQHETREVFYDEYSRLYRLCDPADGEDPLCADACAPFGCTSVVDHLNYVNVTMSHLIC